jgi:hypothetical protein
VLPPGHPGFHARCPLLQATGRGAKDNVVPRN